MSRKENKDDKAAGSGFMSTLLVAGGAAAIGFMASDLWSKWKEMQSMENPHCSNSSRTQSPNEQEKMEARKACRVADEDVPEAVQCIFCMSNPRELILEPCGHVCLCIDCGEKANGLCPVCRAQIKNKKLVYL